MITEAASKVEKIPSGTTIPVKKCPKPDPLPFYLKIS
jgi:hypothetical protein